MRTILVRTSMWTFWLLVQRGAASGAGRHSLLMFATGVSGSSQLPDFSGVLMLDDLQVAYYDSVLDRVVTSSRDRTPLDLGDKAMKLFRHGYLDLIDRLMNFKNRFNQTKGLQVLQRIAGCEVQDGRPTFIMTRDAYNAQDVDLRICNTTHFTYTNSDGWENLWSAARWQLEQTLYHSFYFPTCAAVLKQLLDQKKDLVTRRVPPRMRIFSRQVKGGALLTCLATDFYPRHINLTLLRDGRPVEEDQLGPVLPNGNGLYQVRTTLELTEAELLQKHNYTCAAAHLGRGNGLSMMLRAPPQHTHRVHLVSPLFLLALVLLLLPVLVLAKCRKRKEPGTPRDSVEDESAAMVTPPN